MTGFAILVICTCAAFVILPLVWFIRWVVGEIHYQVAQHRQAKQRHDYVRDKLVKILDICDGMVYCDMTVRHALGQDWNGHLLVLDCEDVPGWNRAGVLHTVGWYVWREENQFQVDLDSRHIVSFARIT